MNDNELFEYFDQLFEKQDELAQQEQKPEYVVTELSKIREILKRLESIPSRK